MKEFIISQSQSGQRSDKFIQRILPGAGKSFIYKMMRKKNIVLNDKKIEGNEILSKGDVLKIWFSDETFTKLSKAAESDSHASIYTDAYDKLKNIEVLYETDDILIADKPSGVLSQKSSADDISLNEWLIGYLKNKVDYELNLSYFKPSVQNRLDRNTSGLVLCSKTVLGAALLSDMIKNRTVKKYYHAFVLGSITEGQTLKGYHIKDEANNKVEILTQPEYDSLSSDSKNKYVPVVTAYKPIGAPYTVFDDIIVTLIEVELITGKSHQIRAHMASVGHPLIGDEKYGNRKVNKLLNKNYQMLHAKRLEFPKDDRLDRLSEAIIESNINLFL